MPAELSPNVNQNSVSNSDKKFLLSVLSACNEILQDGPSSKNSQSKSIDCSSSRLLKTSPSKEIREFAINIMERQKKASSRSINSNADSHLPLFIHNDWVYGLSSKTRSLLCNTDDFVTIPWQDTGMNAHVSGILGATVLCATNKNLRIKSKLLLSFGAGSKKILKKHTDEQGATPLVTTEYGFISSLDIALKDSPQHSLILCPGEDIYYNSQSCNFQKLLLSSSHFSLSSSQKLLARKLISLIKKTGVTKYNNCDHEDISGISISESTIIIVDQRLGDKALSLGGVPQDAFERMIADAISQVGIENVWIKIHPDALSGIKESCVTQALSALGLTSKVQIFSANHSPKSVLQNKPSIFCASSQFGLEALLYGCPVYCYGLPFYSGWGLTNDKLRTTIPLVQRSLEELVWVYLESTSKYYVDELGGCYLEDLIFYLTTSRNSKPIPPRSLYKDILDIKKTRNMLALMGELPFIRPCAYEQQATHGSFSTPPEKNTAIPRRASHGKVLKKIVFLVPSSLNGASALYCIEICKNLAKDFGISTLVVSESNIKIPDGDKFASIGEEILHLTLKSNSLVDLASVSSDIASYRPDIVLALGSRFKTDAISMICNLCFRLHIGKQFEDDDLLVYMKYHPEASREIYSFFDSHSTGFLPDSHFSNFSKTFLFTAKCFEDPRQYRWVDPWLRNFTYSNSILIASIWKTSQDFILKRFSPLSSCILPPVAALEKIEAIKKLRISLNRENMLAKHGLQPSTIIVFLGGTVYSYTNEFDLFLESINRLKPSTAASLCFVFVQGRTDVLIKPKVEGCNLQSRYVILNKPSDEEYDSWIAVCDWLAAPGDDSQFNQLRLPSRLVKGMLLGIPILTYEVGFGESLSDGHNAVLTRGSDPSDWALSMERLVDRDLMRTIGSNALKFADKNFESGAVTGHFVNAVKTAIEKAE